MQYIRRLGHPETGSLRDLNVTDIYSILDYHEFFVFRIHFAQNVDGLPGEFHNHNIVHVRLEVCTCYVGSAHVSLLVRVDDDG